MLKKYFFIVNLQSHALEKIEDGIIRSISSKPKIITKGVSSDGLVYEAHAKDKDSAFIMFHNKNLPQI